MALKEFRPLTPSLRYTLLRDFSELTPDSKPEKKLLEIKRRTGGRNAHGRMTSRHRGGGHKKKFRIIEWNRRKRTTPGTVLGIQYDPNRSARLALVEYGPKDRAYILAPEGLKAGSKVVAGPSVPAEVGNALPLKSIPQGLPLHSIEMVPGRGAQIVRSAEPRRFARRSTASMRCSSCLPGKSGGSTLNVMPRSDRWATWPMRKSRSARRDALAGWAAVRTSAAW